MKPTPKLKRGRPSTGFDKRAYMKEYMRKRRASKAKALEQYLKGKTDDHPPH